LETYLAFAPRGFSSFRQALPVWIKEKLFQKSLLAKQLGAALDRSVDWTGKLLFSEHHLSHAASAFFPSPFERAAVLTMDGVGEWSTTSLAHGNGSKLEVLAEIHFPHSLGLLYSAFTYYTGFRVNSGEYKVMGLAPYGEPRFVDVIKKHLIDIKDDGTFRLNLDYFDYCTGLRMTNERFDALFGGPPRKPEDRLAQRDMDLAASVQAITEEIVLKLAASVAKETGERNLCLAGGVALNCVANGKLLRRGTFDRIWIQPAAGDAGGAVGAALGAYHLYKGAPRRRVSANGDGMKGGYLGPDYSDAQVRERLTAAGAILEMLDDAGVIERTARALADGQAVGWHQGRMEFGPRALGARSILGDARSPTMQKLLNLKVKFRESFRPFAPSVLREAVGEWFELNEDSPYMLLVADVRDEHRVAMTAEQQRLFGIDRLNVARSSIPAVTHVDYSARVQTVHRETNPRYHALISRFQELTGCPIVVNTSFNVRGEPLVCTPEDSFRCFMGTEIDVLVVGNAFLEKNRQPEHLKQRYEDRFELD
ncbi:MAG: carbamoyltransferase family protein, partial [Woeseiaceae bacterium]